MLVSSNAAYLGLCSKVDTYTFVSLYTVTPQPKCSTMAAFPRNLRLQQHLPHTKCSAASALLGASVANYLQRAGAQ